MKTKKLTTQEIQYLEPLAREFFASSGVLEGFDLAHFVTVWTIFMSSGAGVIFGLYDDQDRIVGALGGLAFPDPATGRRTAQEAFWFVTEGARGEGLNLLAAFEQWAKEQDCLQVMMIHLVDLMPERVARIYRMRGYKLVETVYRKEV